MSHPPKPETQLPQSLRSPQIAQGSAPVEKWTFSTTIPFADVDRNNLLSLAGIFKLMQEVAIAHANHYNTGTDAMLTRGESWVLNRLEVAINRYPAYGEHVQVETWSSGIRGFKGYREFRIYDASSKLIASGSSLWLYVSVRNHTLLRVPKEIAEHFPIAEDCVFAPNLERIRVSPPDPETATVHSFTLRYTDFDANAHVNNTAYLDLLQSALFSQSETSHPHHIHIQYNQGISTGCESAEVLLQTSDQDSSLFTSFAITASGIVCATGKVIH